MSEWLVGLISIGASGGISLIVSLVTSKRTLKNELTKMGYQYERDDAVQLRDKYAKMRSDVLVYIDQSLPPNKHAAFSSISEFIATVPESLQQDTQQLQEYLLQLNPLEFKISKSDVLKVNAILKSLDEKWMSFLAAEAPHKPSRNRKKRR